jgi:hypothetical protein
MKKALLIYSVDREDNTLIGFRVALPIPEEIDNYEDAIKFLMPKLTNRQFVERMIDQDCIENPSQFDGLPINCRYHSWKLKYEFTVKEQHTLVIKKELEFIDLEDS